MNLWPFTRPKPAPLRFYAATKREDREVIRKRQAKHDELSAALSKLSVEEIEQAYERGAAIKLMQFEGASREQLRRPA